ncbi:HNH endonuclease [Streptomyces anulatus]|uniref:HNH endonuclease n=1 Tax=Streptomyces anulatus TaxID=1892 RepID=UPI0035D6980D
MGEQWWAVPEFPGYAVSDQGRVRNVHGKILRPWPIGNGYLLVRLYRGGVGTAFPINRLVLQVFIGRAKAGMHAAHNNGVRTDNRLTNLRWATPADNNADKLRHGTAQRGERANNVKVTAADVVEIRRRLTEGETQEALGREFGLTQTGVSRIKLRKNWRHVA